MEFTNEIFFDKPLTVGSTVIITYCGKLYREHSKDVVIVYGYGDNWDYTDSTLMVETDNGFEVTITIKDSNTFNFCFRNSFNIWDNNSGFNYICPISPKKTLTKDIHQQSKDNDDIINDNEYNSDFENSQNKDNEKQNETAEDVSGETENNFENSEQEKIEATFSSLLDSLLDTPKNTNEKIDLSNGFGLQSVDTINEGDTINCDEIFNQLFEELTSNSKKENVVSIEATDDIKENIANIEVTDNKKENVVNIESTDNIKEKSVEDSTISQTTDDIKQKSIIEIKVSNSETPSESINSKVENIVNNSIINEEDSTISQSIDDIKQKSTIEIKASNSESTDLKNATDNEQKTTNYEEYKVEELDSLMDILLTSISDNNENLEKEDTELSTPIQKVESQEVTTNEDLTNETVGLPDTIRPEQDWIDKIINISYNFTKKVIIACQKLGKLIKLKAKQYGIINNDNNK